MSEGKSGRSSQETVAEAAERVINSYIADWRRLPVEKRNQNSQPARLARAFLVPKKLSTEELTNKYGLTTEEIELLGLKIR